MYAPIRFAALIAATLPLASTHSPTPTYPSIPTPYHDRTTPSSFFASARRPQDAVAVEQIRNTMAIYPLIIDGKAFGQFDLIFTPDIYANYSSGTGLLIGIANVTTTLQGSLQNVETQHQLGTQVVDIDGSGAFARSVTYFRAAHFRKGQMGAAVTAGLYAFGAYDDLWFKNFADGEWRIRQRTLTYYGPLVGDESVFLPPNASAALMMS